MPAELASFLTQYGYVAVFALVFIQELGVPNPVPNEIVLLFAGYLSTIGVLSFWGIFFTVVAADFFGTAILYFVFYRFHEFIFKHKPKWLPISEQKIHSFGERISKKGLWGIYVGRLLPYVRGYASVAAGLLRIQPKVFLPAVLVSAVTWSGGYAIAGKLLGAYWNKLAQQVENIQILALIVIAITIAVFLLFRLIRKKIKKDNPEVPL